MRANLGVGVRLTVGILAVSGALVLAQAPAAPPAPAPAPAGASPTGQTPAQGATPAKPLPGTITGALANDTARGATLLADARKALGGDDKFKNIKTLEVKGKSARAQQQATLQGDFEIQIEMPGKYRRKENLGVQDINIDIVQLVNGETATQTADIGGGPGGAIGGFDDGGGGNRGRGGRGNDIARFLTGATSDDPEQQAKTVRAAMARMVMALLLTPTTSDPVAWVGVAESPDGKADVLQFKTADGVETRLLLDEKTHLPLMMQWQGVVQTFNRNNGNRSGGGGGRGNFPQDQQPNQGRRGGGNRGNATVQQATLQMHVSDYKTVNGIKFPFLIQSGANEETTEELVVKNIRINPSFKPEQFSK
jgi:hypothetical protein